MADLQGIPKLITQMAIVCTEKQFEAMCKDDPTLSNKEYVFLDSIQVRNEIRGGVTTGTLPKGCIALIPQDCQAGYLAFLLNSMPIQYLLFGGMYNSKNKVKINKKLVSTLKLFDVVDVSQSAYTLANKLNPIFEEKGIFILDSWEEAIRRSEERGDNGVLYDSLTKSDQRLRNELMKAHVLIEDMTEYFKSKADGVENK